LTDFFGFLIPSLLKLFDLLDDVSTFFVECERLVEPIGFLTAFFQGGTNFL